MKTTVNAYERNPHVLRKLIHFTGYIPANIVDESKKSVTPVRISLQEQEKILRADDNPIDINYEGMNYHTKISKIHMDEANKDIDEVELAIVS